MSKEIEQEDQEQLDQLLEQKKQLNNAVAGIEMQKKHLDGQEEDLLENLKEISTELNNKMSEIQRVYEVDENYSYDKISGELVKKGE